MTTTTYAKGGIPLRNITSFSSESTKYPSSILKTKTGKTDPFADPDTASTICSKSTINHALLKPTAPFLPTSSLQIQSKGKALFNLPSPLRELETPVFSTTAGRPVLISIKATRSSGSCKLVDAESEAENVLASTTYSWGPTKCPIVRIFAPGSVEALEEEIIDEFEITSKSLLSRTIIFNCRFGRFSWHYAGKKERPKGVNNLLVLEKLESDGTAVKIAHLVRNEEFRTPGSRSSSAGNGGRLEMCLGKGKEMVISEVEVVSTVLVMLKREVDRRRALQVAIISTAVTAH